MRLAASLNLDDIRRMLDERERGDPALRAHLSLALRGAWRALARSVAADVPYGYDGPHAHRVASWSTCRERGFASCADAAALILALLIASGRDDVALCIETVDALPDYAHARILVGGVAVEPYPSKRWEAACTVIEDAVALVA